MELRFAFAGFGNVARAFSRMLIARRADLSARYDLTFQATAIATARHGCALFPSGLDLASATELTEAGRSLLELPGAIEVRDAVEMIDQCDADTVFETTTLNPHDGQPAITHIRKAIERGMNVVTANKGPVAFAYDELSRLAAERGVGFRFEGTVMDGAPVFNLYEYCLPATSVLGFSGVLNSTTNVVLTAMESGRSFDEGIEEARRLQIAEANADYDIDGWDAAVKAVALANVLMKADKLPKDVSRKGIASVTLEQAEAARGRGETIRLIARAERAGDSVRLSVSPESVPAASVYGLVRGTSNVLVIETDLMGEIAIFETRPGIDETAYALLSDLIQLRKRQGAVTREP